MEYLAIVAHGFPQRMAQIGEWATPGPPPPMAAPPRQASRRLARQAAQGVARCTRRKAACDQRFRAGGHKARLVGLVGQRRLVFAASLVLKANDIFVIVARTFKRFCTAKR